MDVSILESDKYTVPAMNAVNATCTLYGVQGAIVSIGFRNTGDLPTGIFISQMYVTDSGLAAFVELVNASSTDTDCYTVVAVASPKDVNSSEVKAPLLINQVTTRPIPVSQSQ
jgi:hypothetical protein